MGAEKREGQLAKGKLIDEDEGEPLVGEMKVKTNIEGIEESATKDLVEDVNQPRQL